MKKKAVLMQFIVESFIVTFVSILLGILIGSLISVPVANTLLKNEIESKQEDENEISQNFGMDSGKLSDMGTSNKQMPPSEPSNMKGADIRNTFANNTNYVDKINAIINIKTIGELVLIGVVLTLISSSISMIFIARYSPLKILSNRT